MLMPLGSHLLFFADDVDLFASSGGGVPLALEWFATVCSSQNEN